MAFISDSPDIQTAVPEIQVEYSTPEPAVTQQVDLGSITKLFDSPGRFIGMKAEVVRQLTGTPATLMS